MRELVHLIAGIVDVELTGHVVACPRQYLGQAVTQNAAACITHVHRAGRVGRYELDHDLFGLFRAGLAVVCAAGLNGTDSVLIPSGIEGKVQEAGACDLDLLEAGALERQIFHDRLGNLAGRHAQRLCALHREGGSPVAICGILGHLNSNRRQLGLRQGSGSDCLVVCGLDDVGSSLTCGV